MREKVKNLKLRLTVLLVGALMMSLDLLNHIADITKLPESVKTIREQMVQVQQAVDYERTLPADQLQPLAKFPVTKSLYSHQVRACNMALLTFGVLDPKEVAG